MASKTKIQWTDHTFNPWIGCQKVSPGCANCYALGLELWGPESRAFRRLTGQSVWDQPLRWERQAAQDRRLHLVFCASQWDVFEPFGGHLKDKKGGDPAEWPADLRVREFPQ